MQLHPQNRLKTILTAEEVVHWRLHWLVCDLQELQHAVQKALFGPGAAALREGAYPEFLRRLQAIDSDFRRMIWETKTMLRIDYVCDFEKALTELPKYAEFQEELSRAKAQLENKAEHLMQEEIERIHGTLDALGRVNG